MYRQKCWSLPLSLPLLFQFCVSFLTFSCSPHQHGASFEQQIGPTDEMQSKLISTIYVIYRYNSKNGNRNLVHVHKQLEFLYCLEGRGIFYLIIVFFLGGGRGEGITWSSRETGEKKISRRQQRIKGRELKKTDCKLTANEEGCHRNVSERTPHLPSLQVISKDHGRVVQSRVRITQG